MAGKGEPKLTEEARVFVVQALACFDPPSIVAEAVRKEFGVTIKPQSVEAYDPNKRAGAKLAAKWKALFESTRKAFLEDTAKIGIANRAVRLRKIERIADMAESKGNVVLALQAIEQAAKEAGDAYSNRYKHEHTGKNGGPLALIVSPDDAAL